LNATGDVSRVLLRAAALAIEQKLRSVVDKRSYPPLARQRCKHIIKFATVKHAMVPVKINTETGSDKTGCEKIS